MANALYKPGDGTGAVVYLKDGVRNLVIPRPCGIPGAPSGILQEEPPEINQPSGPAPVPTPALPTPAPPDTVVSFVIGRPAKQEEIVTVKQAVDDGKGRFDTDGQGSIDYASGVVRFFPTNYYTYEGYDSYIQINGGSPVQTGGGWGAATKKDFFNDGTLVRVFYALDSTLPAAQVENIAQVPIIIRLTPYTGDTVVPGSLQFRLGQSTYIDQDGFIYRNIQPNGAGTYSGRINYATGVVTLEDWDTGANTFALESLLTYKGQFTEVALSFYVDQAPVSSTSFYHSVVALDGVQLISQSDADGAVAGTSTQGEIDYQTGLVSLLFGDLVLESTLTDEDRAAAWYDVSNIDAQGYIWKPRPVIPPTARWNAVVFTYLPADSDILGLDPVRLPVDGRVPVFRAGDVAMVMHHATLTATPTLNAATGQYEIDCGRDRLAWVKVTDADGKPVRGGYELDRDNGLLIWPAITGLATPLTVRHTVGDLVRVSGVNINGYLDFLRPLSRDYPAQESIVSSCLLHGNRHARVSKTWDQASWSGAWSDEQEGSGATAELDLIAHPIQVTNRGAVTERWVLRWLNTGQVELIGEHRGLVYRGPFTADIAPENPATRDDQGNPGVPYLVIPLAALGTAGGGWAAGNVVRINTVAAQIDVWIARAVQPSDVPAGDGEDGCEIYCLGNIDRP